MVCYFAYRNEFAKESKIITTKRYKEYMENTEQLEVNNVIATDKTQISHGKWSKIVEQSIKMLQRNGIRQKLGEIQRHLINMRKNVRKEFL